MNAISTLLMILLIIAFFGVMIFVHELGHFLVARACKITVLEFALGMGPKLLSRQSKKTGTVYSLRLLPLGGFCAMLGENDEETTDETALCRRPAWQRALVLAAGAFMNLLTAFLAMCVILLSDGYYISNTVSGFSVPSYAAGLEIGDVVTKVGDTEVNSQEDIDLALRELGSSLCTLTVERDGDTLVLEDIALPQYYEDGIFYRKADFLVGGAEGNEVTQYYAASAHGGLQTGDEILAVNGRAMPVYSDITWEIALSGTSPCTLTVLRTHEDGTTQTLTLADIQFPVSSENGLITGNTDFGLVPKPHENVFTFIAQAGKECVSTVKMVYRSLVEIIAGKFGTEAVSGPIGTAEAISTAASYGVTPLLRVFVIVSINLGIFNLLPLPALDGGRLIFVILEMIRRKPINQKHEAAVHAVGMVLLLGLMALVTVLDIMRLIGG